MFVELKTRCQVKQVEVQAQHEQTQTHTPAEDPTQTRILSAGPCAVQPKTMPYEFLGSVWISKQQSTAITSALAIAEKEERSKQKKHSMCV